MREGPIFLRSNSGKHAIKDGTVVTEIGRQARSMNSVPPGYRVTGLALDDAKPGEWLRVIHEGNYDASVCPGEKPVTP